MKQEIERLIIQPMLKTYNPPLHAKKDEAAAKQLIDEYRGALKGFSADELKRGWELVKSTHETWTWPHFQHIRTACYKCKDSKKAADSDGNEQTMPWHIRAEKRENAVKDYLNSYKNSVIYTTARKGKYEEKLYQYVKSVAKTQAHILDPDPCGIPFDGFATEGHTDSKAYINEQKRAVQHGSICVSIPTSLIDKWALKDAEKQE